MQTKVIIIHLLWGGLLSVAVMGQVQGSPKPEPVIPNFDLPREPTLHLTVDMLNAVLYGSCTYKEVRQASQECESLFFRHLIKEKCKSCSTLYESLQQCISRKFQSCGIKSFSEFQPNSGNQDQNDHLLRYSEWTYCNDGTLSPPGSANPVNYCNQEYGRKAARCTERFHEIFRKNLSFPETCIEFGKARKCMYRVQDNECQYPPELRLMLDETRKLYRCWNPFCVWRRVNSDEKCEVPSSQPSMDSAVEQPKGGIPEDCPVNMARRVTQLPHIDRVTYAQPRVRMQASRTNKKKRPSPQIFFTPPTLSTTPSNAGSGVIVRGPVLPMLTVISGVFFMLLRHT